jgi:uncharacterized membrane protein YoaK (UPF0700 family)
MAFHSFVSERAAGVSRCTPEGMLGSQQRMGPMLHQQGEERSNDVDQQLACVLAAIAGALNTAAFQAVGFFSANMTGNVSSLSDRIALGKAGSGGFFLGIVLTFISGALISTLLVNAGRRRGVRSIYAFSVLTEGLLLAGLGFVDLRLTPEHRGPVLILGLSFLMGLQNAIVTRISNARVRTTHVSGMATDIGIELGMLLDIALGRESSEATSAYRAKLRLHGTTLLAFLLGGVLGALIYQAMGGVILLVVAAVLCAIALFGIHRGRAVRRR